jgi:O-antigen ligase
VLSQWVGGDSVSDEVAASIKDVIPGKDDSGLLLWRIRGLGFMSDPNDLAQAMVMVLPFLWGMVRRGHRLRNAVLVWLPGLVLGYAIYLTHSRGALIGLASLFFFALRERFGAMKTMLGIAGVSMAASVSGFGGGREFSSGEESAGSRIDAWYEGLQMLKSSPLFGVGYGNFLDHHHLTAHNSFVLCFAELGLVGYFFWMALIVLVYQGLSRVIVKGDKDAEERKLAVLLRSSLVAFLTCSWFLSRTYQPTLFLMLGLATSVWYCWMKQAADKKERKARRELHWGGLTIALMVGSILAVHGFVIMDGLLAR